MHVDNLVVLVVVQRTQLNIKSEAKKQRTGFVASDYKQHTSKNKVQSLK